MEAYSRLKDEDTLGAFFREIQELKRRDNLYNVYTGPKYIDEVHIKFLNALNKVLGFSNYDEVENRLVSYYTDESIERTFDFHHKDFILLSLGSYRGSIPSASELRVKQMFKKRRFNLYKRGKIWSNPLLRNGDNFYFILNELNKSFHITPVNLVSYWASIKNYEKVHITNDFEDENSVTFPFIDDIDFTNNKIIEKAIKTFENCLDDKFQRIKLPEFQKEKEEIEVIKELNKNVLLKVPEITDALKKDQYFKKIEKAFKDYFKITKNQSQEFERDTNISLSDAIVRSALLYSYNHAPFHLTLFFPQKHDKAFENIVTLMVANSNYEKIHPHEELFTRIVNTAKEVSTYENQVIKKISDYSDQHIKWQYHFNKNLSFYTSFANSVENICKVICNREKINATVTSRVKEFSSFYNKIFKRANSDKEEEKYVIEPPKAEIKSDGSNEFKSTQAKLFPDGLDFKDAIYEPDKSYQEVFNKIRDIAGVRIICVYDEDVWKLAEAFGFQRKDEKTGNLKPREVEKLKDSDILCTHLKAYTHNAEDSAIEEDLDDNKVIYKEKYDEDRFNYRAFHVTVSPGQGRKNLVEFEGLGNIQCEIQIRSIFAHGWSDVNHKIKYKDKHSIDVIAPSLFTDIENKMQEVSKHLRTHDTEISKLKSKIDQVEPPI